MNKFAILKSSMLKSSMLKFSITACIMFMLLSSTQREQYQLVRTITYDLVYDIDNKLPVVAQYTLRNSKFNTLKMWVPRYIWSEYEDICPTSFDTPDNEHFYKSDFDKGHLVPLGDMHYSKNSMSDATVDINMTMQYSQHNRGVWRAIEHHARKQLSQFDSIIITTGAEYTEHSATHKSVTIPDLYWKHCAGWHNNKQTIWSYVSLHSKNKSNVAACYNDNAKFVDTLRHKLVLHNLRYTLLTNTP